MVSIFISKPQIAASLPKHLYNIHRKLQLMRRIVPLLLLLAVTLFVSQAAASYWFQVVDISPITMNPNSEANFTIAVKGLGSQGTYVQLIFRNVSQGLSVDCPHNIKYVFPAGTTLFNCTMKTEDIPPGNYSFVAGTAAKGSVPGWKEGYVIVEPVKAEEVIPPQKEIISENISQTPGAGEAPAGKLPQNATPGLGVIMAAAALLLAGRKLGWKR